MISSGASSSGKHVHLDAVKNIKEKRKIKAESFLIIPFTFLISGSGYEIFLPYLKWLKKDSGPTLYKTEFLSFLLQNQMIRRQVFHLLCFHMNQYIFVQLLLLHHQLFQGILRHPYSLFR